MTDDDPETEKVVALKPRKCPMCGKHAVHQFRPFCSRRCANLDLGNWLDEGYRVATDEPAEREESFPDKD